MQTNRSRFEYVCDLMGIKYSVNRSAQGVSHGFSSSLRYNYLKHLLSAYLPNEVFKAYA